MEYLPEDRRSFLRAADEAIEARERNTIRSETLKRIRRSVARGATPTAAMLTAVNDARERSGLPRIGLPVLNVKRRKRQWSIWEQQVNAKHESMSAARPLAPPRRRES